MSTVAFHTKFIESVLGPIAQQVCLKNWHRRLETVVVLLVSIKGTETLELHKVTSKLKTTFWNPNSCIAKTTSHVTHT